MTTLSIPSLQELDASRPHSAVIILAAHGHAELGLSYAKACDMLNRNASASLTMFALNDGQNDTPPADFQELAEQKRQLWARIEQLKKQDAAQHEHTA